MTSYILVTHTSRFKSYYKKLLSRDQVSIDTAIEAAPFGLRIKRLRPKIYEARVDISTRILFFADKNIVRLLALGNHDDILRVLKQIDTLSYKNCEQKRTK